MHYVKYYIGEVRIPADFSQTKQKLDGCKWSI